MNKPTKPSRLNAAVPKAETAMDKTTRVVKTMIEAETEKQQTKLARLRKARLERDAHTPEKPAAKAPAKPRKKAATKTGSK